MSKVRCTARGVNVGEPNYGQCTLSAKHDGGHMFPQLSSETTCDGCLALAKILQAYFGRVLANERLDAFIKEREP